MTEEKKTGKKIEMVLMKYLGVYVVKSIKNSTYYVPGDHMTRDTAQKCCEMKDWEVTILDNDILSSIIGKIPLPIP